MADDSGEVVDRNKSMRKLIKKKMFVRGKLAKVTNLVCVDIKPLHKRIFFKEIREAKEAREERHYLEDNNDTDVKAEIQVVPPWVGCPTLGKMSHQVPLWRVKCPTKSHFGG